VNPSIHIVRAHHRNLAVLRLEFRFDAELVSKIKAIPGARWSKTMGCWYLPDSDESSSYLQQLDGITLELPEILPESKPADMKPGLRVIRISSKRIRIISRYDQELVRLIRTFPNYYYEADTKSWTLPHLDEIIDLLKKFSEKNGYELKYQDEWAEKPMVKRTKEENYLQYVCPTAFMNKLKTLRYSEHTIRNYSSALKEFLYFFRGSDAKTLEYADIEKFLLYLIDSRRVSISYHNVSLGAIKFYFDQVLGKPEIVEKIERPRGEKVLPEVLSEEEVARLFNAVDNLKHKCILIAVYSAGLRLSEVVNLKLADIDSERMKIFVRAGKGRKDRYTVLSEGLLKLLREYYQVEKPMEWLFEGAAGGQYSTQSVQNIMREAVKAAGIRKHATVHTLRHSFATHMMESGTDLRYIQSLLGHNSIKTTEIYTHITTRGMDQLKSPFDRIKLS
jgi:integrase/recombinase XerD